MKRILLLLSIITLFSTASFATLDSLLIQEGDAGICTMDGKIDSSITAAGFTGPGYIDIASGLNIGISYSIDVPDAGDYDFYIRYALGGNPGDRDGKLLVNNTFIDTFYFPWLGSLIEQRWDVYDNSDTVTVTLKKGYNKIQILSLTTSGLPNLDYFTMFGSDITAAECIPSYTFTIEANDTAFGAVDYSPKKEFYDKGDSISIYATANSGYFFHSWSGVASDTNATFKFVVNQNTSLTALFYPEGTKAVEGANGYASVQHDNGIPYLLTGGYLGKEVTVDSLAALKAYLQIADTPYVVKFKGYIDADGTEIKVGSNKTLQGIDNTAHLRNVQLKIQRVRNVIVKNVTFSKTLYADDIEINDHALNVWIDSCEFISDREHDDIEDYYDGLIDIKNESSWITISRCYLHDHRKAVLISSGDYEFQDSVQRITFHHNYYTNIASRLPLIRFGKAHIYNNYYLDNNGSINTRLGACVKVEGNYFKNTDHAIATSEVGYLDLGDNNVFINSPKETIESCELEIPYPYTLDDVSELPNVIPSSVRYKTSSKQVLSNDITSLSCYPNPVSDELNIRFTQTEAGNISFTLSNILGIEVYSWSGYMEPGKSEHSIKTDRLKTGTYFITLVTNGGIVTRPVMVQ